MLIREKVNQAIEILKEFNLDCWITFARESKINGDPTLDFLLTTGITWHTAIILTPSGNTYAIVGQYDKRMVEDIGIYKHVLGYIEGIKEPFLKVMREINPSKIALNYSKDSEICDGLTYGMYLTLYDFLSEIGFQDRLISAEPLVSALRQRKTKTELAYMKEAIRNTEEIFDLVTGFIRPGRTEKEIAEFMKKEVEERKLEYAWDEKICPAVFTGPGTAEAHYGPTDRKVEKGHVLNIDFGVKYNGYCSDLQRTFYVLEKHETTAPSEVQNGFNTIVSAIELAKQAIKPGVKGVDVDSVARRYIVSNGYEEFPHGLGHQVGRFAHDGTALLGPAWEKYAKKPFVPIEKGMVFTIEPRLTVPGRGVVTIENMVIVTSKGAEWLSSPQKELILI